MCGARGGNAKTKCFISHPNELRIQKFRRLHLYASLRVCIYTCRLLILVQQVKLLNSGNTVTCITPIRNRSHPQPLSKYVSAVTLKQQL